MRSRFKMGLASINEVDGYMIRISSIYETGWILVSAESWEFGMSHFPSGHLQLGKEIDFSEAISNLACIFQHLNGPQH